MFLCLCLRISYKDQTRSFPHSTIHRPFFLPTCTSRSQPTYHSHPPLTRCTYRILCLLLPTSHRLAYTTHLIRLLHSLTATLRALRLSLSLFSDSLGHTFSVKFQSMNTEWVRQMSFCFVFIRTSLELVGLLSSALKYWKKKCKV